MKSLRTDPIQRPTYEILDSILIETNRTIADIQRALKASGSDDTWDGMGMCRVSIPVKSPGGWDLVCYELSSIPDYRAIQIAYNASRGKLDEIRRAMEDVL